MLKAVLVKEVAVRIADRVGELSKVLAPIAELRLNIDAINTVSISGAAQVSLIVEDTVKVVDALKRAGFTPWEQDVVAVEIANEAGAVAEVAAKLAQSEIDIRASWASTGSGVNTTLYLWTADNALAVKKLTV